MKRPEGVGPTPPVAPPPPPTASGTQRRTKDTAERAEGARARRFPRRPPRASTDLSPRAQERDARRRTRDARRLEHSAAARARRAERAERRRFTRRSRHRRMLAIGSAASLAVLIGGVAVVTFSPLMSLTTIEVTGTQRLDAEVLGDALEDHLGTPLALISDEAIREDLAEFAILRSYATEIVPPSTLIVRVVERAPIGAVQRGSAVDLVDAAGVVVDSVDAVPEGLPRIDVDDPDDEAGAFAAVAGVLVAIPRDLAAQLESVSATTRDDVSFELRDSGHRVIWGDAERSAYKARVLAAAIASTDQGVRWEYDVSAPDSLVTRRAD